MYIKSTLSEEQRKEVITYLPYHLYGEEFLRVEYIEFLKDINNDNQNCVIGLKDILIASCFAQKIVEKNQALTDSDKQQIQCIANYIFNNEFGLEKCLYSGNSTSEIIEYLTENWFEINEDSNFKFIGYLTVLLWQLCNNPATFKSKDDVSELIRINYNCNSK